MHFSAAVLASPSLLLRKGKERVGGGEAVFRRSGTRSFAARAPARFRKSRARARGGGGVRAAEPGVGGGGWERAEVRAPLGRSLALLFFPLHPASPPLPIPVRSVSPPSSAFPQNLSPQPLYPSALRFFYNPHSFGELVELHFLLATLLVLPSVAYSPAECVFVCVRSCPSCVVNGLA